MTRGAIAMVFELDVLTSTACALLLGLVWSRGLEGAFGKRRPARHVWWSHPLFQFGVVCALIALNQVLFNAYVLRVHAGDPSFLARYLPPGWCAVSVRHPVVQFVAAHIGSGHVVAPSVLRVQAFLELPFTLFAYLAVARMLSARVYRALVALPVLALASLSFSVAFSLAELSLSNPWTNDDLALRAAACLLTPLYIAWLARRDDSGDARPRGARDLLAFVAGAGAIAYVVLALYDALLLYNLAHLEGYASGLLIAAVVAALASVAASRVDVQGHAPRSRPGSPAIAVMHAALSAFTLVFFVPSLAIRYFGMHLSAQACGALLVFVGCVAGGRHLWRAAKTSIGAATRSLIALVALAVGLGAGVACGLQALSAGAALGELALARVSIAILVGAIVVARAVELALGWMFVRPRLGWSREAARATTSGD